MLICTAADWHCSWCFVLRIVSIDQCGEQPSLLYVDSTNNRLTVVKIPVTTTSGVRLLGDIAAGDQEHEHGSDTAASKEVTGEVVDMMCYVDHNAVGKSMVNLVARSNQERRPWES